ncbi:hypothetical protein R6Q59_019366 [Mikania micrantha]
MTSINFNPFGENWFKKPPNPLQPINLYSLAESLNPFKPHPQSDYRSAYHHTPEVERILNEAPIFEKKENPAQEEIEENERWLKEFREIPVVKFLARADEVLDEINKMELKENSEPFRWEDKRYWKSIPHVIGPDGRPIPMKAIKTKKESDDRFWDFAKQFFFGLWGFRQRPYPPSRPIDVAQAIGYKRLEKRYYDAVIESIAGSNVWWMMITTAPCFLHRFC